jgi:hypothetical protein
MTQTQPPRTHPDFPPVAEIESGGPPTSPGYLAPPQKFDYEVGPGSVHRCTSKTRRLRLVSEFASESEYLIFVAYAVYSLCQGFSSRRRVESNTLSNLTL